MTNVTPVTSLQMTEHLQLALDIGEQILICGGEVSRVEDTVDRICKAYGADRVDVFAITSLVSATVIWQNGVVITQSRRIRASGRDMYRLENLNALSRRICEEKLPYAEAEKLFTGIMQKKSAAKTKVLLGSVLAAVSYTAFFGGDWGDCLTAPLVAIVIFGGQVICKKINNNFISQILCSFLATTVAVFGVYFGLGSSVNQIMMGCIMLLIPGISITHAVENLILGDTISGLLSFFEAVITALALAGGFALAITGTGVFLT